jgi:cold shock CspA family protein
MQQSMVTYNDAKGFGFILEPLTPKVQGKIKAKQKFVKMKQ